jgi:hypothetical protein
MRPPGYQEPHRQDHQKVDFADAAAGLDPRRRATRRGVGHTHPAWRRLQNREGRGVTPDAGWSLDVIGSDADDRPARTIA